MENFLFSCRATTCIPHESLSVFDIWITEAISKRNHKQRHRREIIVLISHEDSSLLGPSTKHNTTLEPLEPSPMLLDMFQSDSEMGILRGLPQFLYPGKQLVPIQHPWGCTSKSLPKAVWIL